MVAPPSKLESLSLRTSSEMADKEALQITIEKKRQLLTANKQKARILLLGISTESYVTSKKWTY